jgi:3-oxoacyl-[acyl-carrier-protein] synthase-1
MSAETELVITALGAVTPVGLSAAATAASLRAGIARLDEIESSAVPGAQFAGEPMIGGRVQLERYHGERGPWEWPGHDRFAAPNPTEPERMVAGGHARLVELLVPALRECVASARVGAMPSQGAVVLYLGLDNAEPGAAAVASLAEHALERILRAEGWSAAPGSGAKVVPIAAGRAAALVALARAAADLREGRAALAIVGGVDSLVRPEVAEHLERTGRLKGPQRPHGVSPGEAAAFICVETALRAAARGAPTLARVLGFAVTAEPTVGTDEPNQARGLTHALREARRGAEPFKAPPLFVCDLNGDRYRAMEWGFASMRAYHDLHGDEDVWHPADSIGDSGAASGAVCLVWAATALCRNLAGNERVVVWGASETAERAAATLAPPERRS